jgi:adenylate cyclase
MIKHEERQLSAIMFTDMVGYSAMAQENESQALELLEEHRTILRPFFPKHGGHEVETIGDAFFVEFSSALEATKCAIEIQASLLKRNIGLPKNQHINIRIGIHLGDVVHKADNVLGDEVNIAARIEPLAKAGGICVSEDVARQVRNKIEYSLVKLKSRQLKNISLPVEVYEVKLPWSQKLSRGQFFHKTNRLFNYLVGALLVVLLILAGINLNNQDRKENSFQQDEIKWSNSIAVLPFTDMSPNQDQEYFCDGMTDQILTNLAKLNALKVIARTSVMKFKNSERTIPEIGKELKVENILEGSVRKFGNRLRVTAQLVKTEDGSHIWAEDYDREYAELFTIQDEISEAIADVLSEKLSVKDLKLIKTNRPVNLEAYEYFLKAEYLHRNKYWSTNSQQDFLESEQMFLKAIELDSLYAPSYAGLVDLYNSYYYTYPLSNIEKEHYLKLQEKYIRIAYDLDSLSSDVNRVLGWVYGAKNDIENEFKYMNIAAELDPNDPENTRALGIFYDFSGLLEQASRYYKRGQQLDPFDAKYHYYQANIHFHLGRYLDAKTGFKNALELESHEPKYLSMYAWTLIVLEEIEEAEKVISTFKQLYPKSSENNFLTAAIFAARGDTEKAFGRDLLDEHRSIISLYLELADESIVYLEKKSQKMKQKQASKYLTLKNLPMYDFLRSDQRFQEILDLHKTLYEQNLEKFGDIEL